MKLILKAQYHITRPLLVLPKTAIQVRNNKIQLKPFHHQTSKGKQKDKDGNRNT